MLLKNIVCCYYEKVQLSHYEFYSLSFNYRDGNKMKQIKYKNIQKTNKYS